MSPNGVDIIETKQYMFTTPEQTRCSHLLRDNPVDVGREGCSQLKREW